MFGKKILKRCGKGHEMELDWLTCPKCTGRKPRLRGQRDIVDATFVADAVSGGADETRIVTPSLSRSRPEVPAMERPRPAAPPPRPEPPPPPRPAPEIPSWAGPPAPEHPAWAGPSAAPPPRPAPAPPPPVHPDWAGPPAAPAPPPPAAPAHPAWAGPPAAPSAPPVQHPAWAGPPALPDTPAAHPDWAGPPVAPAAKPVAPNHPDWAGPPAAPAAPPAHAPHPDWAGPPAVPAAAPPAPPAPPARPAPPPPAATPRPAPPPAAAPAVEPVIDNLGPALSRDLQARSRAKLECTGGPMSGRMFMLSPGVYRVGKSPKDVTGHKTIVITGDKFISKDHATITVDSQKIAIEDPGSTNGSFVNGEKISNAVVKTGDMLRFGETIFRLTVTGS